MTLVLKGTALNEKPMSLPMIGRFDERGGTLGRSDTATFTLPDPERAISRVQAQILYRDDGYWIENVSAAIPVLHNGRPLSAGMRVTLREADELKVGGYTLVAAFENDATSATILRGRTVITQVESARELPTGGSPDMPSTPRGAPPNGPAEGTAALSGESLWAGFLEGAGIALVSSRGPSPDRMRGIGAMLRIAVGGIHRLVTMRSLARGEIQTDMTMIQARDNNPLKFAPDEEVALQMLLQPPARGFMEGPAALRAALADLESHQVAMMAGMHAALDAVLARFDPGKLEAPLAKGSVFDALRPAHRRARLWDQYLENYGSLRREAKEEFQGLFSAAFRDAYEAQLRSLEGGRTR